MATERLVEATLEDVQQFGGMLGVQILVDTGWIHLRKDGSVDTDSLPLHTRCLNNQAGINEACGILVRFQRHMQLVRRS